MLEWNLLDSEEKKFFLNSNNIDTSEFLEVSRGELSRLAKELYRRKLIEDIVITDAVKEIIEERSSKVAIGLMDMPDYALYQIAYGLDYNGVLDLCRSNTKFNHLVCESGDLGKHGFWERYLAYKYNIDRSYFYNLDIVQLHYLAYIYQLIDERQQDLDKKVLKFLDRGHHPFKRLQEYPKIMNIMYLRYIKSAEKGIFFMSDEDLTVGGVETIEYIYKELLPNEPITRDILERLAEKGYLDIVRDSISRYPSKYHISTLVGVLKYGAKYGDSDFFDFMVEKIEGHRQFDEHYRGYDWNRIINQKDIIVSIMSSGNREFVDYVMEKYNIQPYSIEMVTYDLLETNDIEFIKYILNIYTERTNFRLDSHNIGKIFEYGNLELIKFIEDSYEFSRPYIELGRIESVETLKYLIEKYKYTPTQKNLSTASYNGHYETFIYFVDNYELIPSIEELNGAIYSDNLDLLKFIVEEWNFTGASLHEDKTKIYGTTIKSTEIAKHLVNNFLKEDIVEYKDIFKYIGINDGTPQTIRFYFKEYLKRVPPRLES